jgi:hypothetical protein
VLAMNVVCISLKRLNFMKILYDYIINLIRKIKLILLVKIISFFSLITGLEIRLLKAYRKPLIWAFNGARCPVFSRTAPKRTNITTIITFLNI